MECPLCDSPRTAIVYTGTGITYQKEGSSLELVISICNRCGFVFQESAYSESYNRIILNEYLNYNKNEYFVFPNRSEENLITIEMIVRYLQSRKNFNILEIGSNRGDLLYMIKQEIPNVNILGIEPTNYKDIKVPTINSFFKKELFLNKFDFIIIQHVFEHIKYPKIFINDIKDIISGNGILYIEVPNIEISLKHCIDDFTLDHVSYFNFQSLEKVLKGFKILEYSKSPFLRIIAQKDGKTKNVIKKVTHVQSFKRKFSTLRTNKRKLIKLIVEYSRANRKIVFYGVGYYFRILYKETSKFIDKKNCYFMDDSFGGEHENNFNIPRLNTFDENCVVIICSTNFKVQGKIEKKLFNYKRITIIKPWLGIVTV